MVSLLKIQILSIIATSITNLVGVVTFATDYWSILVYDIAKLRPYSKWMIIEEVATGNMHIVNSTNDSQILSQLSDKLTTIVVAMDKGLLLYSTHKGLFRQCNYLSEKMRSVLQIPKCGAVKTSETQYDGHFHGIISPGHELIRLYNVAAACAILIVLLLCSGTFIGIAVGILNNVVLATMTVGVIYLIAALFSTFVVAIMHTIMNVERKQSYSAMLEIYTDEFRTAHTIRTAYSYILGYSHIILCLITSVLWLLLQQKQRKFAQH